MDSVKILQRVGTFIVQKWEIRHGRTNILENSWDWYFTCNDIFSATE